MMNQQILNNIVNSSNIISRNNSQHSTSNIGNSSQLGHSKTYDDSFHSNIKSEVQVNEEASQVLLQEIVSLSAPEDSHTVVNILKKPFKTKYELNFVKKALNDLDIWKTHQNILNQSNNFNNIIFSHMKIQNIKKGDILFNYGDSGTLYYIVAKGSFGCLIPKSIQEQEKKDEKLREEQKNNKSKVSIQTRQRTLKNQAQDELMPIKQYIKPQDQGDMLVLAMIENKRIVNANVLSDMDEERFIKAYFPTFQKLRNYLPGESFGEEVLLTSQKERKYVIIAREDSCLITLEKSKYDKILNIYQELQIRNNIDFLHNFSFLSELGPSKLLSLLHSAQIVNYQKPSIIYKEGDKSDFIYFIRQGEVKLTQLGEIIDDKIKEQRQKEQADCQPLGLNQIKQQQVRQKTQTRVSLVIYQENSFFGEDEIMNDSETRKTRAEVHSLEAEIFIISKTKLIDYLKSSNVYDVLVKEYQIKNKWRSQQYKHILNMKLDAVNQQYSQMKKLKGQECKQEVIEKIQAQIDATGTFFSSNKYNRGDSQVICNSPLKSNEIPQSPYNKQSPTKLFPQSARIYQAEFGRAQSDVGINIQTSYQRKDSQNAYLDLSPTPKSPYSNNTNLTPEKRSQYINSFRIQIQNSNLKDNLQRVNSIDDEQRNSPLDNNIRQKSQTTADRSPKIKQYSVSQYREAFQNDLNLEQKIEIKKKFPSVYDQSSRFKDSISSPKNIQSRIPPELSAESLNEVLEQRSKYKQELMNEKEKYGKISPFFMTVNSNSKKIQEIDMFKIKKDKSQPIFIKSQSKSKDLKTQKSMSPTHSEFNIRNLNSNIGDFSQRFQILQKQNTTAISPYSSMGLIQHNNFQQFILKTQNDEPKEDNVNIGNIASEQNTQTQISEKQQNTDEGKNTQVSIQICYQPEMDKNRQSNSFRDTHYRNNSENMITPKHKTKDKQQTQTSRLNEYSSSSVQEIISMTQHNNYKNQPFYLKKILNIPAFISDKKPQTPNQFSRKNLSMSNHISMQLTGYMGESTRNSSQNATNKKSSNSSHQQLLQYNNLDVKPICIQQKTQVYKNKKGQLVSDFGINSTEQHKNRFQMSQSNRSISSSQYQLTQNTQSQDKPEKIKNLDWESDQVKEYGEGYNQDSRKKNLEKECKYINLKKIFKDTKYNSKIFKHLENNSSKETFKKDTLQTQNSHFEKDTLQIIENKSFGSPQQKPLACFTYKQSPSSVKPINFVHVQTTIDSNKQNNPASFLTTLSLHPSKKTQNNA